VFFLADPPCHSSSPMASIPAIPFDAFAFNPAFGSNNRTSPLGAAAPILPLAEQGSHEGDSRYVGVLPCLCLQSQMKKIGTHLNLSRYTVSHSNTLVRMLQCSKSHAGDGRLPPPPPRGVSHSVCETWAVWAF